VKTYQDKSESLTARQQVHALARLRMEVLAHKLAAALIGAGALWLAWYFETLYPLALLPVAGYMALKARFLADGLPKRDTPGWQRRLALWLSDALLRRRMARAKPSKPYRVVKVNDGATVNVPLAPGEARRAGERAVIYNLTVADVYYVVNRAYALGLSERATDEYGAPVWRWEEGRRLGLPSGAHLSRGAFRAVQAWLVAKGFATATPYGFLAGVKPDDVLEELEAL
jgi:hypothetical protein